MKIEETETTIRLIPENDWEKDKLESLRERGVEKTEFQDDWNRSGYLVLHFPKHPWDSRP